MTNDEHILLWNKCLAIIKDNVSEQAFQTWFQPIIPLKYGENSLTIQVPSQFFYEYLEDKYIDLLRKTIYRVIGAGTILNYRVLIEKENNTTVDYPTEGVHSAIKRITPSNANKSPNPFDNAVASQDLDSQLNPKYTFDNYLEGKSNKLARTAGMAVAENPGKTAFNPLFIHGASGVGKTHLCHAIGIRIKEKYPQKRVLYVSAHLFQVQYADATKNNSRNDFINFYQSIDTLIIDDIQELIGKEKTQNAFFHIFNHLHQIGKQLILTSDKAPVELEGLEDRLITRMKWGLTADLEMPDIELRRNILAAKIKSDGLTIAPEVIDFIATNVKDNVRDLEGIVVSLMAHSLLNNKEIDLDLAKKIVAQSVRIKEPALLSVEKIKEVVCRHFDLEEALIQSGKRTREVCQARQIAMFLSKKLTDKSLAHIGTIIGKRDHATVLHACRTVRDQIEIDKSFRSTVDEIEKKLTYEMV
ncbi:MAG: chromosomal replication initiator protein DnaA [Bacteroidales bacterium]|nr:chromosomal replication initiator protein DnaA [Bacteroidales bacterium]